MNLERKRKQIAGKKRKLNVMIKRKVINERKQGRSRITF